MDITRTLALLAAGFLMAGNALHAKPRTCRMIFPDRPQDAPKRAYLFDGKKSHAVDLPNMNFSEVIELPEGALRIALLAGEISGSAQVPAEAPALDLPAEVGDFYLLVSADPENAVLAVKLEWIDVGSGKLQAGETLWCNFTEHRITAKLGEVDLSVEPQGRTVSKQPLGASGYYDASFSYQVNGAGDSKPITEQSWWHDASSRHLGFISYTHGKLPVIRYFRDFRIPNE